MLIVPHRYGQSKEATSLRRIKTFPFKVVGFPQDAIVYAISKAAFTQMGILVVQVSAVSTSKSITTRALAWINSKHFAYKA